MRDVDAAHDRTRESDEERTAETDAVSGGDASLAASDAADHAPKPGDSLIWPPPEEELNGWEVVHLESTGRTLIEPLRPIEDAPRADALTPERGGVTRTSGPHAVPPPPAPRLYSTIPTPPAALPLATDDGLSIDRSLRPERAFQQPPHQGLPPMHPSRLSHPDENLPETQVIEPLLGYPIGGPHIGGPQIGGPQIASQSKSGLNAAEVAAMDPLAPTPAMPLPALPIAGHGPGAAPQAKAPVSTSAPKPPQPQIIVQGGTAGQSVRPMPGASTPTAPIDPPTAPRLPPVSSRDQTQPRIVIQAVPGRPGSLSVIDPSTPPEAGVDPSAMTRIMPIPQGLARARVPASMIETLRDDKTGQEKPSRTVPTLDLHLPGGASSSAREETIPDDDPQATNVWPSPPLPPPQSGLAQSAPQSAAAQSAVSTLAYQARTTGIAVPSVVSPEAAVPGRRRIPLWYIALIIIALAAIAEVAYLLVRTLQPSAGASLLGTLVVESMPSGADVAIDGTPRGRTPFRLDLTPGSHEVAIGSGAARRTQTVTVTAGAVQKHAVDLSARPAADRAPDNTSSANDARTAAANTAVASLNVQSDPAGARVTIDGIDRGRTPVTVSDLKPGRHHVHVSGPFRAITRTVHLSAGEQESMTVTPPRAAPETPAESNRAAGGQTGPVATVLADPGARVAPTGRGWVTVDSPIVLRVVRNGDFLGTSEDGRIPLPAGSQVIGLENESVNFREVRTIEVPTNRGVTVAVALPQGTLNINAVPWAEVFVDNQRIGETPVSQLALPIGPHDILYRHPQFGDRRVTVIVKVGTPGRTFVDFTK